MTALPAIGYLPNSARTKGEMKVALDDTIKFLRERMGDGSGWTSVGSAATVNLGSQTSRLILLTGTTSITSFGTTNPGDNILFTVRFAGILTLTHGSNLLCPNAASIVTAAGDMAFILWEGSNVWRVVAYFRANGTAVADGATQRAAIGAAPLPTASAGVGNFINVNLGSSAYTLPAGGTWAYMVLGMSGAQVVVASSGGLAAGGTTVLSAGGIAEIRGFAWRVT